MTRMGPAAAVLVGLSLASPEVAAQVDKPRFVFILDNSTSMSANVAGMSTHGDGSQSQPGCDLDGKSTGSWPYDDSKLYQAKAAIIDTISAFGSAEFALATYARVLLGQPCQTDSDCTAIVAGASCVDFPTMPRRRSTVSGTWAALPGVQPNASDPGCTACANPADTNDTHLRVAPARLQHSLRLFQHLSWGAGHRRISHRRLQFSRHLQLDRRQRGPASFHRNLEPRDPGRDIDAPGGQHLFRA